MSTQERNLERPFLALDLDGEGAHPAAATSSGITPAESYSGRRLAQRALAAESAGFNALVFADRAKDARTEEHPVNLAAAHAAAFIAPLTHRVALIAEADTVFAEPFHLATQLQTIDHSSVGRAGWLVAASQAATEAQSLGRETPDDERVRREVTDGIEVNRRLWDSWEDDAEIRDVPSGRFIDAERIHNVDFAGEYYSVKSASIVPRSPQGQIPVIASASVVDAGADIDVVQVSAGSVDQLIDAVRDARQQGFGRVIAELAVVVDALGQSAAERIAELDQLALWNPGALAAGTAEHVAVEIGRVLAVADGIRLRPAVFDRDLPELAGAVLPALREQLPLADSPAGSTFRDLLGLERPASRYATSTTATF